MLGQLYDSAGTASYTWDGNLWAPDRFDNRYREWLQRRGQPAEPLPPPSRLPAFPDGVDTGALHMFAVCCSHEGSVGAFCRPAPAPVTRLCQNGKPAKGMAWALLLLQAPKGATLPACRSCKIRAHKLPARTPATRHAPLPPGVIPTGAEMRRLLTEAALASYGGAAGAADASVRAVAEGVLAGAAAGAEAARAVRLYSGEASPLELLRQYLKCVPHLCLS